MPPHARVFTFASAGGHGTRGAPALVTLGTLTGVAAREVVRSGKVEESWIFPRFRIFAPPVAGICSVRSYFSSVVDVRW